MAGCEARASALQRGAALTLARVAWVEAGASVADVAAIYHLHRRARGDRWVEHLRRYSASRLRSSDRVREVMSWPWGDLDDAERSHESTKPSRLNRLWRDVREEALRCVRGECEDPCGADHYGSRRLRADRLRAAKAIADGRWMLARCARKTANAFYVRVKR